MSALFSKTIPLHDADEVDDPAEMEILTYRDEDGREHATVNVGRGFNWASYAVSPSGLGSIVELVQLAQQSFNEGSSCLDMFELRAWVCTLADESLRRKHRDFWYYEGRYYATNGYALYSVPEKLVDRAMWYVAHFDNQTPKLPSVRLDVPDWLAEYVSNGGDEPPQLAQGSHLPWQEDEVWEMQEGDRYSNPDAIVHMKRERREDVLATDLYKLAYRAKLRQRYLQIMDTAQYLDTQRVLNALSLPIFLEGSFTTWVSTEEERGVRFRHNPTGIEFIIMEMHVGYAGNLSL